MKSRPGIVAVVVWVCREGAGRPAGRTRLADATLARKVPLHCQLARQPGCTTDSARQGAGRHSRSCGQGISDSEREFWTVMELCACGRLSEWLGRYANTAKTVVQQLLEAHWPVSRHEMQSTYDHPLRKQ